MLQEALIQSMGQSHANVDAWVLHKHLLGPTYVHGNVFPLPSVVFEHASGTGQVQCMHSL